MEPTPASLLERLRQNNDEQDWERFVEFFTPFLYHFARNLGLGLEDAADLVQDVFALLVRKLPEFTYDRSKSFRSWLRTVTINRWRENHSRRAAQTPALREPLADDLVGPDPAEETAEAEFRQSLIVRALRIMQANFQPATWKGCWEQVVAGRSAAEVATELGISEGAAYVAKHRVLRRLREELKGLLD